MFDVKHYKINFQIPMCSGSSKVNRRLSEAKAAAVAPHNAIRRLTPEQRTYRNLANLANAIIDGRFIGNFIEVNGKDRDEIYKEFFG